MERCLRQKQPFTKRFKIVYQSLINQERKEKKIESIISILDPQLQRRTNIVSFRYVLKPPPPPSMLIIRGSGNPIRQAVKGVICSTFTDYYLV